MTSTFLRRILIADAAISGTTGVAMFAGASFLGELLALPVALLRYSGFSLLPFAAVVLYLATRNPLPRIGVWTVIVANFAWVAASIAVLFATNIAPNGFGYAFVIVQALAVAALADMQYFGLRKAAAA
ncbi:MAG TPA: hypothetical protein VF787_19070 [Thermoanaerobaculia bacterium]